MAAESRAGDTVRALVEARAEASPDAAWLIAPDERRVVTFAALAARCRQLARDFARHGARPGERVAFLLPNGAEAASLFVAAMAAGMAATPLSLVAQPDLLAYVLAHSGARLVYTDARHRPLLAKALGDAARLVAVAAPPPWPQPDAGDPGWPFPAPKAGDDALLMYTSGTTGRPKGVRLSQNNVLAGARFVSEAHALGPADRALAVLPLYHINAQIVTVLATLVHGGSLVMPERFSAKAFWPLAARYRCTWLNVVPTIIAYLLNGEDGSTRGLDLASVRFCRSASAPLSPDHHRAFESRFGIGIVETMGLTETAAPVFTNPLDPARRKIGSPGQAFGSEARIADTEGRSLADGETGEIQIRGANVMQGYLDDEAETARTFTGDGWLKTGDLGHRDRDGFYFVTGRLKELIIKGGENIAPREIDEVLLAHPALLEAAAIGIPDPFYGQDVAAGVVARPGQAVGEAELLDFCRERLGRFKAPREIRLLSELPKGPSGKIQRLKLLALWQDTA